MMFHKHNWHYIGGERVETARYRKTFFVSFYQCAGCQEYSSTPVDMQLYLDMKEVKL